MKFPLFSSSASSAPLRFVKYTLMAASISFVGDAIASVYNPTPANAQLIGQQPPSPPRRGTPGGPQTGGGTRPGDSKCPSVNTSVIAFMPAQGNTTQESPTFWFYVPYSAQQVDSFTFVLMDDKGQLIVPPKNIKLSATPGFISLRLPPISKPLEIGKQYRWYFEILCDAENPEDKIDSQGVLRRITPTFTIQNQTAIRPLIEQYQKNGLSFDAFNLLAELRRKEPNNPTVIADWNQMMESLGHSNIAAQPIVSCCSLE
jgi:Domain of Unknown Function (DUF928)